MSDFSFFVSPTCQAFDSVGVGSQVSDRNAFETFLSDAIKSHDSSLDRAEGQHFVSLPLAAVDACGITCGVGRSRQDPGCYAPVVWRGKVNAYLKRTYAAVPSVVNVVVYTRAAFLSDPQVQVLELSMKEDYAIVAVLADPEGAPNARSAYRLVDCLAGNNNEAEAWTYAEIYALARASIEMEDNWSVVYG